MKRALITGARSPASLDLMRRLSYSGFEVYAADSVSHPLSRASNCIKDYFILPSPTHDAKAFTEELRSLITKHKIDILIPTCEEVFFISKYKSVLAKECLVFCDDFYKLSLLHNKYDFLSAAENCGAFIPDTRLICSSSDIEDLKNSDEKVLKPVFSRFASHTLIKPAKQQLQRINVSKSFSWVAQEYITGTEYCTYGIAVQGKLQAHICYEPTYRAGLGSGIYFTPYFNEEIQTFVNNFVKKHHYTGQIGFDFMITKDNKLYVLECNPRATSGIHCLPEIMDWNSVLSGAQNNVIVASAKHKMVALAMLTFGLKYISSLKFIADFMKAKDPVWDIRDIKPSLYQLVSLAEIIFKSVRNRISLKEAATADIEWNGEVI